MTVRRASSLCTYIRCCEQAEQGGTPTVAIIDSQIVKSAKKRRGQNDPTRYDAAKNISGKKRHVLVNMQGELLRVEPLRNGRTVTRWPQNRIFPWLWLESRI
jgi:hypothetical protein